MEDYAALPHRCGGFLIPVDQVIRRGQVVGLAGDLHVVDDPLLVGAGDVPEAAVLLVHVVKGDPGRDDVPARRAPEVEVVLVVGFLRAEPRRFHEELIALEQGVFAGELTEDTPEPAIQREIAEQRIPQVRIVDLSRSGLARFGTVQQIALHGFLYVHGIRRFRGQSGDLVGLFRKVNTLDNQPSTLVEYPDLFFTDHYFIRSAALPGCP